MEEVTLNLATLEELLTKNMYYGSTVGRVANRVAEARFTLADKVGRIVGRVVCLTHFASHESTHTHLHINT